MFCFLPLKYPYGRLGIVNCVQAKGVYTHISKPVWILATTDVSDTDQEHSIILGILYLPRRWVHDQWSVSTTIIRLSTIVFDKHKHNCFSP